MGRTRSHADMLLHRMLTVCLAVMAGVAMADTDTARLEGVLAAQPADVQARYPARRPAETLAFFGVAPGTTVIERSENRSMVSAVSTPWNPACLARR